MVATSSAARQHLARAVAFADVPSQPCMCTCLWVPLGGDASGVTRPSFVSLGTARRTQCGLDESFVERIRPVAPSMYRRHPSREHGGSSPFPPGRASAVRLGSRAPEFRSAV